MTSAGSDHYLASKASLCTPHQLLSAHQGIRCPALDNQNSRHSSVLSISTEEPGQAQPLQSQERTLSPREAQTQPPAGNSGRPWAPHPAPLSLLPPHQGTMKSSQNALKQSHQESDWRAIQATEIPCFKFGLASGKLEVAMADVSTFRGVPPAYCL